MKNKKNSFVKILLSLVLCVIFGSALVGCSPITLSTMQSSGGGVVSTLTIDLSSISSNFGKVQTACNIAEKYASQLTKAYEDRMIELFANKYDYEELGLASRDQKMLFLETRNEKFAKEVNVKAQSNTSSNHNSLATSSNSSLVIETKFYSIYAYIMYFYPNAFMWNEEYGDVVIDHDVYQSLTDLPVSSQDLEKDEKLFFISWTQICTPFSYNGEEPKLLEDITINSVRYTAGTSFVKVACSALGLSEEEADYVFSFSTPYRRVWSDGSVSLSEGKFVHSWDLGSNIMGEVRVSRKYANYVAWYVTGLILGLGVVGVGVLTTFIVRKIKKKRGLKTMQSIVDFMNDKN